MEEREGRRKYGNNEEDLQGSDNEKKDWEERVHICYIVLVK